MANLIEGSVRLPAFPPAFAFDVEQAIDARCQFAGFRAQLRRTCRISAPLKQRGEEPHSEYTGRIQRGDFVQVSTHHFQQVVQPAVISQAVAARIELLPVQGSVEQILKNGFTPEALVEPGEIAGHAQVVVRAPQDGEIVGAVPRPHALTRQVIRGEMLVHILNQPVFHQAPKRLGIE